MRTIKTYFKGAPFYIASISQGEPVKVNVIVLLPEFAMACDISIELKWVAIVSLPKHIYPELPSARLRWCAPN